MKKLIAVAVAAVLGISTAMVTLSFSVQETYAEEHTDNIEKPMAVSDIIYTVLYTGEETNIDNMLNVIDAESGKNLTKDINYRLTYKDNVEVGTATVYIDGIGEYEGCHLTTTYNIVKNTLAETDNTGKTLSYIDIVFTVIYTGKETNIDNLLVVSDEQTGKTLTRGLDYRLTYKDNVEVGTATVYIDGIGEYEGCHLTTTYNIVKGEKEHVKVSFDKYSVTLYKSQQFNLKAYVNRKASNDVEWKSSNNRIAKVSKNGKVTAVSKGEAVITAVYQNDKESAAECKIKVNNYSTKMSSKVQKIRTNDSYTFNNKLITSYTQMKKLINKYSKTNYDKSVMKKLKKYNKAYFKNKAVCIGTISQPAGKVTSVKSVKKVMKYNGKYTIKVMLVNKDISNVIASKNKNSFNIVVEISQKVAKLSDKVEIK